MKTANRLICVLFIMTCASAPLALHGQEIKPSGGCRIESPQRWKGYSAQWIGLCAEGLADGTGVLRGSIRGVVQELYFGRVNRGVLAIGVIETKEGYIAGHFSKGKPAPDGDRESNIRAFREAVDGANYAKKYYEEKKNGPSAKFYAAKANSLSKQMD